MAMLNNQRVYTHMIIYVRPAARSEIWDLTSWNCCSCKKCPDVSPRQRLGLILHASAVPMCQPWNPKVCHCQPPWPVSATARAQRRWPSAPYHPKGCQCECWQVAACYFLGVHQGWKKSWCCWERHRVRQRSCPAFSPLETTHPLESPWFKRWKLCDHTMALFDMGDGMNRLVVRCTLCVSCRLRPLNQGSSIRAWHTILKKERSKPPSSMPSGNGSTLFTHLDGSFFLNGKIMTIIYNNQLWLSMICITRIQLFQKSIIKINQHIFIFPMTISDQLRGHCRIACKTASAAVLPGIRRRPTESQVCPAHPWRLSWCFEPKKFGKIMQIFVKDLLDTINTYIHIYIYYM